MENDLNNNMIEWPRQVRLKADRKTIELIFESEEKIQLSACFLREHSPSHNKHNRTPLSADTKKADKGGDTNLDETLRIHDAVPIGNYALRLVFSDGHDTAIYTYNYLAELSKNPARLSQSAA